jgi:ribosome maturation factor RimP
MYFEFDFLFIFNKYILDPFSVKKADFGTVVGKELYVVYSTSWYDDKKEMEGVLTRVGDLRIYIDDINNQKQEIEIFDLAYFFARL